MNKAVLVVATSDRPAIERIKAAYVATAIAEYFRDQGLRVLLLMDSVTRFARAQREIGLAAGEAPTRRGFPPPCRWRRCATGRARLRRGLPPARDRRRRTRPADDEADGR